VPPALSPPSFRHPQFWLLAAFAPSCLVEIQRLGIRLSAILDAALHGNRIPGMAPVPRSTIPDEFQVAAELRGPRLPEVLERRGGVAPDDDEGCRVTESPAR
jgi:hypothetical protein